MRKNLQAGESKLGCLAWILVLAVGALIGWEVIPVRVSHAQLQDFMVEQSRYAASSTTKQIKQAIFDRAVDLNLPVEKKQISVKKQRGQIMIDAQYIVYLDFPFYTHEWKLDHHVDRPFYLF